MEIFIRTLISVAAVIPLAFRGAVCYNARYLKEWLFADADGDSGEVGFHRSKI